MTSKILCLEDIHSKLRAGKKLTEKEIDFLTDEPIKKKIKQTVDLQGFKKLIELEYEKHD